MIKRILIVLAIAAVAIFLPVQLNRLVFNKYLDINSFSLVEEWFVSFALTAVSGLALLLVLIGLLALRDYILYGELKQPQ